MIEGRTQGLVGRLSHGVAGGACFRSRGGACENHDRAGSWAAASMAVGLDDLVNDATCGHEGNGADITVGVGEVNVSRSRSHLLLPSSEPSRDGLTSTVGPDVLQRRRRRRSADGVSVVLPPRDSVRRCCQDRMRMTRRRPYSPTRRGYASAATSPRRASRASRPNLDTSPLALAFARRASMSSGLARYSRDSRELPSLPMHANVRETEGAGTALWSVWKESTRAACAASSSSISSSSSSLSTSSNSNSSSSSCCSESGSSEAQLHQYESDSEIGMGIGIGIGIGIGGGGDLGDDEDEGVQFRGSSSLQSVASFRTTISSCASSSTVSRTSPTSPTSRRSGKNGNANSNNNGTVVRVRTGSLQTCLSSLVPGVFRFPPHLELAFQRSVMVEQIVFSSILGSFGALIFLFFDVLLQGPMYKREPKIEMIVAAAVATPLLFVAAVLIVLIPVCTYCRRRNKKEPVRHHLLVIDILHFLIIMMFSAVQGISRTKDPIGRCALNALGWMTGVSGLNIPLRLIASALPPIAIGLWADLTYSHIAEENFRDLFYPSETTLGSNVISGEDVMRRQVWAMANAFHLIIVDAFSLIVGLLISWRRRRFFYSQACLEVQRHLMENQAEKAVALLSSVIPKEVLAIEMGRRQQPAKIGESETSEIIPPATETASGVDIFVRTQENVVTLFVKVLNFSAAVTEGDSAVRKVALLDRIFSSMDDYIASDSSFYRVKTVRNLYFLTVGLFGPAEFDSEDQVPTAAAANLMRALQFVVRLSDFRPHRLAMKCGICLGDVSCGVIGAIDSPMAFDVYGVTVNAASRATSVAGTGECCLQELAFDVLPSHVRDHASWQRRDGVVMKGLDSTTVFGIDIEALDAALGVVSRAPERRTRSDAVLDIVFQPTKRMKWGDLTDEDVRFVTTEAEVTPPLTAKGEAMCRRDPSSSRGRLCDETVDRRSFTLGMLLRHQFVRYLSSNRILAVVFLLYVLMSSLDAFLWSQIGFSSSSFAEVAVRRFALAFGGVAVVTLIILSPLYSCHWIAFSVLSVLWCVAVLGIETAATGWATAHLVRKIYEIRENFYVPFRVAMVAVVNMGGVPLFIQVILIFGSTGLFMILVGFLNAMFKWYIDVNLHAAGIMCLVGAIANHTFDRGVFRMVQETSIRKRLLVQQEYNHAALLKSLLPEHVVALLRRQSSSQVKAELHLHVSILYADVVSFTQWSATIKSSELVVQLSEVFAAFEEMRSRLGLCRIKLVGDCIHLVGGLTPEKDEDHHRHHTLRMLHFAFEMIDYMVDWPIAFRVGIHVGNVVAGVVGTRSKFSFDVFGRADLIAEALEESGVPAKVHVSESMRTAVLHRTRSRHVARPRRRRFSFVPASRSVRFSKMLDGIHTYFVTDEDRR